MIRRRILLVIYTLAASSSPTAAAYVSIVTGGSGFVGRHVLHSLLRRRPPSIDEDRTSREGTDRAGGEVVVSLVRPEKVPREQTYWDAHAADARRSSEGDCDGEDVAATVRVMPYDMLDGGATLRDALERAVEDVDASAADPPPVRVYHMASTFGPTPDPIRTARENVESSEAVARSLDRFRRRRDVRCGPIRLILTSSMAAVRASTQAPLNGEYYTRRDWNTLSELDATNWGSCYQWSKAESERRARELVNESNERYTKEEGGDLHGSAIEMISLCPSFVFGPPPPWPSDGTCKSTMGSSSYSLALVEGWLRGKSPVQSRLCVDVRDVAKAHVAAGELLRLPEVNDDRRYIISTEERLSSESTAKVLIRGAKRAQEIGEVSIDIDPSRITCDTQFTGGAILIGNREVEAAGRLERDLGLVCRPVEDTIRDMAQALLCGDTY